MVIDAARVLRASKLRIGTLRAQGVPAIFLGAAVLVLAFGTARSVAAIAPMLPESLREMKSLIETSRADARLLSP